MYALMKYRFIISKIYHNKGVMFLKKKKENSNVN